GMGISGGTGSPARFAPSVASTDSLAPTVIPGPVAPQFTAPAPAAFSSIAPALASATQAGASLGEAHDVAATNPGGEPARQPAWPAVQAGGEERPEKPTRGDPRAGGVDSGAYREAQPGAPNGLEVEYTERPLTPDQVLDRIDKAAAPEFFGDPPRAV